VPSPDGFPHVEGTITFGIWGAVSSPVVTICTTTSLTFSNSTFCPHSVFVSFVWIWEQTAIISLYNINWLVFITETGCAYCAVRIEYLEVVQVKFSLHTGPERQISHLLRLCARLYVISVLWRCFSAVRLAAIHAAAVPEWNKSNYAVTSSRYKAAPAVTSARPCLASLHSISVSTLTARLAGPFTSPVHTITLP